MKTQTLSNWVSPYSYSANACMGARNRRLGELGKKLANIIV